MSVISFSHINGRLSELEVPSTLGIVVCIPCYNEPHVDEAVRALLACELPPCAVEVLVLMNTPEESSAELIAQNKRSYESLMSLVNQTQIAVVPIHVTEIPKKHRGVGQARKLALDEGRDRLNDSESKTKILACFDADCSCASNYLTALYGHFKTSNKEAVSIYYEHPTADFNGNEVDKAIYIYELHLRYFICMQRLIDLPFAIHTVGSSMACTVAGYTRIGGMNRRQAGEDFYFLQKFIQDNQCDVLVATTVFPSARISDRVPFGTGRAVGDMVEQERQFLTYNAQSFADLKLLVGSVDRFVELEQIEQIVSTYPDSVKAFLKTIDFDKTILRLKQNTKSMATFKKAFYQFFDAFQLMKYLHFVRDNFYQNVEVIAAAKEALKIHFDMEVNEEDLLQEYRKMDAGL